MKLEKGYHFLIIFLWPSTVCKYGTGKTGRTSSLGVQCGTGNGWNWLWNRGGPSVSVILNAKTLGTVARIMKRSV